MRSRFNPLVVLLIGIAAAACSTQGTKKTAYDIFVNEYCTEMPDDPFLGQECVRKNDIFCEKDSKYKHRYLIKCKGSVKRIIPDYKPFETVESSFCYHSPDFIASIAIQDLLPQKTSTICSAAKRFGKVQAQITHSPRINDALSMKKRLYPGEDLIVCMAPASEKYNSSMLVSYVFAFDRNKERLFQLYSYWLDEDGESQDRNEWVRKSRKRYEGWNEGVWDEGTDQEQFWTQSGVFYPFHNRIMNVRSMISSGRDDTEPCFSSKYVEYESENTLEYRFWVGG